MPARISTLAPGQLIAQRFVIERMAGIGGMGVVYRARDMLSQAPVAVKVVSAGGDQRFPRFAREARLLAKVSHPAVVRYVAHGVTDGGEPFLAMEWLEGEDLAARLSRTGLKVDETLLLMRRACAGLAAVHAKGVVHRDLKPGNLFLVGGRPEAVKLLDFGVARQADSPRTLTRAGSALGTVGYMAPEQAMGLRDVDTRADVFALGCVLFECLTGRPPFEGPHDVAVLAKVLREEVPRVRDLRPDVADSLDAFVAQLLSKDRTLRPRDAGVVLDKLEQIGDLKGAAVPATGRPTRAEFADTDQHIASVVLARPLGRAPATLTLIEGAADSDRLDELLRRFNARPVPLRAGHILLVFGAARGVIASDQAAQAVRCALALSALKPQLRIGVATGSLTTALNISVGEAIDRACALLEPSEQRGDSGDEVLIDELSAGLVHGAFKLERRADGLAAVSELEQGDERERLLLGRPSPCVGREKELGLLEATLAESKADQVARALLVTAQPGAGKSRLAREFLARTRAKHEARALVAHADPSAMRAPMRMLQLLLRQALGARSSDDADARGQRLRDYLATLVEPGERAWLGEFLGELLQVGDNPLPSELLRAARADPAVMREQTRRAVQHWLSAELARKPLVLVLDDLQWADPPSVNALEEALLALGDRAIFLLALGRPDTHDQFPGLFKALGSQELRLTGLTQRAAERLVREMLPDSPAEQVASIVNLADGNAFYLEELIRRVADGRADLPETVRAVVRSRLDALSPEARRHLRAASVYGETSWVSGVKCVLGQEADIDVESWFELLSREEVFVRRKETRFPLEVAYSFRHALLRDAAYSMLGEDERRLGHALAGDWLERMGEQDPGLLADHYERGASPERARPMLLRAARQALGAGDLQAAQTLALRGLSLGAYGRERGELLLVQAHASAWGTHTNLDLAREALELLPRASSAWWFALALLVFGASAIGRAALAEPYLELATQTEAPSEREIGASGQAFEVLALGAVLVGRADIAWSIFEKFRQWVEAAPDSVSRAWLKLTHCQLATNSLEDGRWQLELAILEGRAAVEGMRAAGAVSGEATALLHLGIALREAGCFAEAEQTFKESLERAQAVDNVLIEEFARLMLVGYGQRRGAQAESERELSALSSSTDANVVQLCQTLNAQALLRRGDFARAAEVAEKAAFGPGLLHRISASLIWAAALQGLGDAERARKVLGRAARARGAELFPKVLLEIHELSARLARALSDQDGERAARDAAREFASATSAHFRDQELRLRFERRARLRSE